MSEINEINNGVGINAFIQQTTSDMTAISEQILHDCPYTACEGKSLRAENARLKELYENEREFKKLYYKENKRMKKALKVAKGMLTRDEMKFIEQALKGGKNEKK